MNRADFFFDYKFSEFTFFGFIVLVPLYPYGLSGLPGIDFTIKNSSFYEKNQEYGTLERYDDSGNLE